MSAVAVPAAPGRRALLKCTDCREYFPASARRVRAVLAGKSSRLCPTCRSLARRTAVNVEAHHRHWWHRAVREERVTYSGETVTQEWIDEVADQIWGKR